MSTLCFDAQNLDAAVQAVIAGVQANNESGILVMGTGKRIPITDTAAIRQHLVNKTYKRYQQCVSEGTIQTARIEDMIYKPVGFVFEIAPDIFSSEPPTPEGQPYTERYTHLAMFWSVL
ncbi:MAG: hypothetical protein EKK47_20100 [Burkholderiales bacterium]|nr:MAG: hypothetical protein EKK47_20100 [Burkholderiales bacterium]